MIKYNKKYNQQLLQLCIKFGTQRIYSRLKPTKRRISKYNYLYEYVLNCTKQYLDDTYPFGIKLYWVLNEFQDFPKCEVCLKPILFKHHKSFRLKIETTTMHVVSQWPRHCSTKCAQNNILTRNACKNTSKLKYGTDFPWQNKSIIQKIETTMENKYGKKHYAQTTTWKNKVEHTNIKNIGAKYHMQLKHFQEKAKQTYFNKTGFYHALQNPYIQQKIAKQYFYDNKKFDSAIELAYYIWLTDQNVEFVYQPINKRIEYIDINNVKHIYYPDFFLIKTNTLIELKGDNHFDKKSGKLINISNSHKNYIAEAKYNCMLENNVKIIKQSEMKDILVYVANKFGSAFWYKKYKCL